MLISTHPIQAKNNFLVKSILDNGQIIDQVPDSFSTHNVEKKFLMLSNEVGYFNKITKFVVGNEKSLLFLDNKGEQCYPTIEEVLSKPRKYFCIYPIPCNNNTDAQNFSIELETTKTLFGRINITIETVILDFECGINIGKKFFNYKETQNKFLSNFESSINGCENNNNFWPNKNFLINSNKEFCLGILLGYFEESSKYFINPSDLKNGLYLQKNDNIYVFATILNWLGAGYSIINLNTKIDSDIEYDKKLLINFHRTHGDFFEILLQNPDFECYKKYSCLFKNYDWFIQNQIKKMNKHQLKSISNEYNKSILSGEIILIPAINIKFLKIEDNEELYDATMPRADATNYSLPFTPIMKNSDGDILTLSAIFGIEAIEDAKPLEPNTKEWFRNLNDGEINQWISDDAILGLYAATKFV